MRAKIATEATLFGAANSQLRSMTSFGWEQSAIQRKKMKPSEPIRRAINSAPRHSMTSSARATSDGGILRPMAAAAFRFTEVMNLAGS
jgi:hypothetical protein